MTGKNEVRVAQVGCGYWGRNLVRNYAEMGALAAIVDGDATTARTLAERFGIPARTWPQIVADPAISAVSLATPAATHAAMAMEAITAGKHVFVEKPLALSSADARQVVDAAAAAGVTLMVGHLLHYHPAFQRLRSLISEGTLGTIRYLFSNRMSFGKFRVEENVLWSFAPHDVSMILALVGEEPQRVTAQGAAFVTAGIADWATVQLAFPGAVRGHIQVSWASPYKEHRLAVVGTEGMAVFEDSEPDWGRKLALYRHRVDCTGPVPMPVKADAEYVGVEPGEPLQAECAHFLRCAASGVRPRTDGREGIRVLRVLERAEAELTKALSDG
jgi:UDP-2-acetamido-3-amino-2,3-dideoxy-glucuronate N-acetyltransferase